MKKRAGLVDLRQRAYLAISGKQDIAAIDIVMDCQKQYRFIRLNRVTFQQWQIPFRTCMADGVAAILYAEKIERRIDKYDHIFGIGLRRKLRNILIRNQKRRRHKNGSYRNTGFHIVSPLTHDLPKIGRKRKLAPHRSG
ncbi:hypothetical protein [Aurantiacibacter sediminis]|uniref:Uncharacterized protein n=2 Tax=Aurantiacibacter sediminis TaxID=2793064 RepID=A0ABS0N4R2_9SPHN|nr:hypothetical protein [Aurantiacibacter sediminis]